MTGGSLKSNNTYISDKYELERLRGSIDRISNEINIIETNLGSEEKKLSDLSEITHRPSSTGRSNPGSLLFLLNISTKYQYL